MKKLLIMTDVKTEVVEEIVAELKDFFNLHKASLEIKQSKYLSDYSVIVLNIKNADKCVRLPVYKQLRNNIENFVSGWHIARKIKQGGSHEYYFKTYFKK